MIEVIGLPLGPHNEFYHMCRLEEHKLLYVKLIINKKNKNIEAEITYTLITECAIFTIYT